MNGITLFGVCYLIIIFFALLGKYERLAYIYALSYLFQSSAVLVVAGTGMQPYTIAPLILWMKGLSLPQLKTNYSLSLRKVFSLFLIFVVLQGLFCTNLFEGLRVYQIGGMETNLGTSGIPLRFGIRNIYQWYCLGVNLLGIYSIYVHRKYLSNKYALNVIVWSAFLVLGLGIWRYLTVNFGGWFPVDFLYSNVFMIDNIEQVISGRIRFTSIFLEASWCGLFLSVWVWNLFLVEGKLKYYIIPLLLICTVLTLSSTGLLLLILGVIIFFVINKKIKYLCFVLIFLFCFFLFLKLSMFGSLVYSALFEKVGSDSADSRIGVMLYSLRLFTETKALGCGLGSSIGANLLLNLLSQLGLAGTLFFCYLLSLLMKNAVLTNCRFILFPVGILILGLCIAGGTLTQPLLWLELVLLMTVSKQIFINR